MRMGCGGMPSGRRLCQFQACKSSSDLANCTDPDANSSRVVSLVKLLNTIPKLISYLSVNMLCHHYQDELLISFPESFAVFSVRITPTSKIAMWADSRVFHVNGAGTYS